MISNCMAGTVYRSRAWPEFLFTDAASILEMDQEYTLRSGFCGRHAPRKTTLCQFYRRFKSSKPSGSFTFGTSMRLAFTSMLERQNSAASGTRTSPSLRSTASKGAPPGNSTSRTETEAPSRRPPKPGSPPDRLQNNFRLPAVRALRWAPELPTRAAAPLLQCS